MYINLVDGNSLGRAYFNSRINDPNGTIAGFLEGVIKSLIYRQDMIYVIVWDGRADWRYQLYPDYKKNRDATPELREARVLYEAQRDRLRELLAYLPVVQLTAPDAEADDLAYQLVPHIEKQGYLTKLFTADSDWLQMVSKQVHWVNARRPAEEVTLLNFYTYTNLQRPNQIPMMKAMGTDKADNIIGVKGIGDKRAQGLLDRFGTLENILILSQDLLAWSQELKVYHALSNLDVQNNVLRNYKLVDLAQAPRINPATINVVNGENDLLSLGCELAELNIELNLSEDKWAKFANVNLSPSGLQILEKALYQGMTQTQQLLI